MAQWAPTIARGDYVRTKPPPTRIRCKGYSAPPDVGGIHLGTCAPGTYLGPVEEVTSGRGFITILVRGWWINVSSDEGGRRVHFATRVQPRERSAWARAGWYDAP